MVESETSLPEREIVELSLLLTGWQAAALAAAARARGLTAGQLVRQLISELTIQK